jgi:glutathione S-transferase
MVAPMSDDEHAPYELYYWPGLPGRGELIRLALEDAGAPWIDVALDAHRADEGSGFPIILELLKRDDLRPPPFAPPVLRLGDRWVSHVAAALDFLGQRHGLAPADEAGRSWALQLQLTLTDFISEIHDTHHAAGSNLAYEDQLGECLVRARSFREARGPKFLGYFARVLDAAGSGTFLVGDAHSYVDLSLAHVLDGLEYALPRAFARLTQETPRLLALRERVHARPNVAAWLASDRRQAFNESGIFRRYPELDDPA